MICLTPKPKFFCQPNKRQIIFSQKKSFLREMWSGGLNKKQKEGVLTALATVIKKGPIISIRKQVNELKGPEKTVGTAIKQDLSRDLDPT